MKLIIVFFSLIFTLRIAAQDTLHFVKSIPIENYDSWDFDPIGNFYYAQNGSIYKLDSTGKTLFTQSLFGIGKIQKIDASLGTKIAVFSSEQQLIQFYDNTLTLIDERISLSDFEQNLVTDFCLNQQSDQLWIWDEADNKLSLLREKNSFEIGNIKQTLNSPDSIFIHFFDGNCYVFGSNKQVLIVDRNGAATTKMVILEENSTHINYELEQINFVINLPQNIVQKTKQQVLWKGNFVIIKSDKEVLLFQQ